MSEKTVKDLATEALSYFERRKRKNEEEFWTTKEGRPDWLRDLIYKAHNDMLPDDYKYEFIYSALCIISDSDEEYYNEGIDSAVDIYTHNLTKWLHSHIERVYYITSACEEYGSFDDGFRLLATAQYMEREEVFYSVLESLNEIINNEDEDEDEQ